MGPEGKALGTGEKGWLKLRRKAVSKRRKGRKGNITAKP